MPFVLEVMGIKEGRGWIPLLALATASRPVAIKDAQAQGCAYTLKTREWRIVRLNESEWAK